MKVAILLFTFFAPLSGQSLSHSLLPSGDQAPTPRVDGAIAYDATGKQILTPRHGHVFVLDSTLRSVILFGGEGAGLFSDAGLSTSQPWLGASSAIPASMNRGRDRIVISHGFASGRPLRRCLHYTVHDQANGEMPPYGGFSSGSGPCPQADLWAFNLSTNSWQQRTPSQPTKGRQHYGVAFDAAKGNMVTVGGSGGRLLSDSWEHDAEDRSWQTSTIEGPSPSARHRHQAAKDPDDRLGDQCFSAVRVDRSRGEAVSIGDVNLDPETSVTVNRVRRESFSQTTPGSGCTDLEPSPVEVQLSTGEEQKAKRASSFGSPSPAN